MSRPWFGLLTDEELSKLHSATLEVLERVGVAFHHEKAVDLLHSLGCRVDKRNIVRIPAHLVEQALERTPSSICVYDRTGNLRMRLQDRNVYFGAGLTCPSLVAADGARKPYTRAECEKNARVADALEHVDFTMAMAHVSDVPAQVRDVHEISIILKNSIKPIIITSHTKDSLDTIVDICGIISGSKDAFLQNPYLMYYTEPVSPLQHTTHSLDKLFAAVEYGLPILNTPAPMAGGTAPITLCGTLISGFAELLSGLVLIQHYRRGTPVIFGGVFTTMDMKSMIFTYGSPELQLMNTAIAQLAQRYRIPSFGTAGVTDAHTIDEQAAFECANGILLNALSGSNLVHDVGWLGSASGTSNELLVLCDEIIGHVKRYMQGIDMSVIDRSVAELVEAGPGGNFLNRDLTLERFKEECWYPRLMNRKSYSQWTESGKISLGNRLMEETARLGNHAALFPLADNIVNEIDQLLAAHAGAQSGR